MVQFKEETTFGPTKAQLKTAQDAINNDAWTWEYQVNVYFRLTDSDVGQSDLRELLAQHYPLDKDGLPADCAAFSVGIFQPSERTVEGINLRLDNLDGDWELCVVLDYFLKSEFTLDRSILDDFVRSLPDVQWQIESGWYDVS